ncbi:MAG: hypothetical protein II507_04115 [Treponema sp.]|nr:hypothetical protein [Treponema sp.]
MKKQISFIFLLAACIAIFAQTKESLLDQLRQANTFENEHIGDGGQKSNLYAAAQELVNLCTDSELVKLLSDKSPVVKCYAACFVQDKNLKADWYQILLKETSDYEEVYFENYDLISTVLVGDYFLKTLFDKKLTKDEQYKIKLELIKKQSKLSFAKKMLHDQEKSNELYEATRKWALTGNADAIFSLAKYKKEQDLHLIELLKDKDKGLFFKACLYNLSASHKPFLKEYMLSIMAEKYRNSERDDFYKLIAAYHDNFSKEIFDMAFSNKVSKDIQKYHLESIYEAIKGYQDGFYYDYIKKLQTEYNFSDDKVIDYLRKIETTRLIFPYVILNLLLFILYKFTKKLKKLHRIISIVDNLLFVLILGYGFYITNPLLVILLPCVLLVAYPISWGLNRELTDEELASLVTLKCPFPFKEKNIIKQKVAFAHFVFFPFYYLLDSWSKA